MSLIDAIGSAIYSKLAAGTALTAALGGTAIYFRLAPQGTACPYVVHFLSSGADDNTSPRRARSYLWTVKNVGTSSAWTAGAIDDLCDALLHEQTLTVDGWGNYWTARTTDISYPELEGGIVYWHVGGQYRVRIAE